MVGIQELSLLKEGVSEAMQGADAPSQQDDSSRCTPGGGKTTGKEDLSIQKETSPPAKNEAMQHHSNMEIEEHNAGGHGRQELTSQGLDNSTQNAGQQVEENTIDRDDGQLVDGRAQEDDGKPASTGQLVRNGVQMEDFMEEPNIQEDDLLKTVREVLEGRHLDTRPIPVLVKGKEVDLLKLCVQVRACGGYDIVTMWSSISKSLGFGPECGPLLKLVYVKYLKGLENRRLVASQGVQSSQNDLKGVIEDANVKTESMKAQPKSRGVASAKKRSNEEVSVMKNSVTAEQSLSVVADGSDSLAGVVEWVKRLALNPGDPKKGLGIRVSRWNEARAGECEMLASRVRAVLWKKDEHSLPLHDSSPPQENNQKKRGREKVSRERGVMAKKSRHTRS